MARRLEPEPAPVRPLMRRSDRQIKLSISITRPSRGVKPELIMLYC